MSQEHTIQTIITALNETEERPRGQIAAIVRALGEETALAVLVEANEVEATGGMMLPDGSRRRTPGGVFFAIARRRLSPEAREAIFPKTPPAKKEGEKTEETPAARPDRRHVRLIRPGEPPRSRSEAAAAAAVTVIPARGNAVPEAAPTPPAHTTNGVEHEKPEVKLVRLDRRRIVPLSPLKTEEPKPAPSRSAGRDKSGTPRRSGTGKTKVNSNSEAGQLELKIGYEERTKASSSRPAGLDLAFERSQLKKRVATLLDVLDEEQRRLVLLDLLAEVSDGSTVFTGTKAPTTKPPAAPPVQAGPTPELRSRILAAVGDRLGISVGTIARTIFGADTPSNRRRVKTMTSSDD